jgi:phage terminase large subunit-like protein
MTELWSTACRDWQQRLESGRTLVPDLPLFEDQADLGEGCFRDIRIPDIAGTPRIGDVAGDWIFPIVRAVFGSFDKAAGRRMIREFFISVSKKNGKTFLGASIMLTAMILNRRPQAEMILVAPTKDIADRAFKQVEGSILLADVLRKTFHIARHVRTITDRVRGATLMVKAADTDVITGVKSMVTLLDETHVFSEKSNAADIFVEIRGALASRPDGFLVQITTQSKRPPAGVFKQELQNARDVRDGKLELPLLPVLYEYPRDIVASQEWRRNEKLWPLVNPNLGLSVDMGFLRDELMKAEREGINALTLFASQHFNIEIGIALGSDRWAGAEFWERQTDPSLTLEELLERSEVVVCGMDGGGLDDLFGFCVLGRDRDGRDKASKSWLCWSHAWCHSSVLVRRQQIAPRLLDFQSRGELTICDDELGDLEAMQAIIADIKARNILAHVAVDPAGVGDIVDAMAAIGITEEAKSLWPVGQGFRLMNALKTSERRLAKRTLWHSENTMMNWSVSNLKIEPTATAIRATKMHAGDAKIDAAMAMFNACDVMSTLPEPMRAPNYDVIFA